MLRFMGWMAAAGLLLGCEGTHRSERVPLQALPGDAPAASAAMGVGSAGSERTPTDLELTPAAGAASAQGAACAANTECASGFCVDGVCCQSSCDTVCSRCDTPGSEGFCSIAANDVACTLSCPESGDCRSYGSGALTANCEAIGRCRALTDCTATDAPAGTACQGGAGSCDGQGECIVADRKRLGEACAADDECAEGNCVVGSGGSAICCDAECSGLCQSCGATGRCNETPRDDARCAPVDCPDDNLCRDYLADLEVNLCRGFGQCRSQADCTFTELRSGAQCSCGPSGCTLAAGSSCTAASECGSGACEQTTAGDAVCCAQACPAGQSCTPDGSRCVQCDAEGVSCEGNVSRRCANGVLSQQMCGNGCNQSTGLCNPQRPTGSVCDGNAQCQSGTCALDVSGTQRCCTAGCAASGRACGTDGSCVCPAGQQDVGGTCRRTAGQACTQASDCASGFCVNRVSGGGSVCCAQGCNNGTSCTADGTACVECAGAGSTCQGNTSSRCDDGDLIQTTCGNGCNAASGVCNGLLSNGQTCTAAAQCASNTCGPDRNGAQRCCTPNCAASGRVCGTDGSCVCPDASDVFVNGACRNVEGQACAQDGDCRSGNCEPTQGGAQVCCSGACGGQLCRASGQGCVACEGNASSCQANTSRSCVNNAFVNTTCANGCNVATGLCNNLIPRGGTGCSNNNQCAGSGASCQSGRCCEFNCAAAGRVCDAAGICQCPADRVAVGNACLIPDGSPCNLSLPEQCRSESCNRWFLDMDGDLHGAGTPEDRCGDSPPPPPPGSRPGARFVAAGDDCCDGVAEVFPGQTQFFLEPHGPCVGVQSFDYDCNGVLESFFQAGIDAVGPISRCVDLSLSLCSQASRGGATSFTTWVGSVPPCGQMGNVVACQLSTSGGTQVCSAPAGFPSTNSCR